MLAAILTVCTHNLSLHTHGGGAISSSDLLRVALRLPAAAPQAVLAFVDLLHRGVISGRAAVYCISDLRLYLQERTLSMVASDSNHVEAESDSISINLARGPSFSSLGEEFLKLATACLGCIRSQAANTDSIGLFNSNNDVHVHVGGGECCSQSEYTSAALELLPCVVELAMHFAEDVAFDIIDSLFHKSWPSHLLLTLCNLMCDLLPFLSSQRRHLSIFQVS